MEQMEKILQKAILALPQNDAAARQEVYEKAKASIAKLDDNNSTPSRTEMLGHLEKTIEKIETQYKPLDMFSASHSVELSEQSPEVTPVIVTEQAHGPSRTKWFIAAVALIICCTGITFFYLYEPGSLVAKTRKEIGFSDYINDFVAHPKRNKRISDQSAVFATSNYQGKTTLLATGSGRMFLKDHIPVDTAKNYRLSVTLRVKGPTDGAATTRTIVGLATYDENKKLQSSKPGAHRYGTLNRTVSSEKGWQTYSGIFSGVGDLSYNMFREGTKFVRPMMLFNFKAAPTVQTEIAEMIFEEVDLVLEE